VYTLGVVAPELLAQLEPAIRAVMAEFARPGEFEPTRIEGAVFFATEGGIDFKWHQDHESFFVNQSHRNYVNFWAPVIKPDRSKSNLSVIPADNFRQRRPDLWDRLEWGGAASAVWRDGTTIISDDFRGGLHGTLDFRLEELAETPELDAGDVLLMRGDLFHQTQDADTTRVAVSVRVSDGRHTVTRAHFETTCPMKDWYRSRDPKTYDAIAAAFATRESMTLDELHAAVYGSKSDSS
jgi:ectoine hydroxylase-related dioxygenase (phytanoyl-CoA dioxygenase family)